MGFRCRLEHGRYYGIGMEPNAIGTRTLLWFGHGCCEKRMQLEHGRYYGLGMDAVGMVT